VSHSIHQRKTNTALATAVLATLAAAQTAGAQPVAADEATVLAEIIVTAQKREQKLQDVPIAVSVVGGDLVDTTGGYNAESLVQLVPSLNIRKTNTQLNQALFLRGVGTINFAIAAQPSVAFVLDGVVLSSAGEAFGDMYDVERVEVLRGPQGTLFGKNASAGVVNLVSKKPGDELGGYVDLAWYEDNEMRVKAALDAPISDRLHTRTTATYGNFDGYIDNISATPAGGKLNGYDRWGVRSIWVANPNDNVELTFIGDYRKSDDNCCVEVIGPIPAGPNAAAVELLLGGSDYFKGDESRKVRQNLVMTSEEEAWGLSAQADIAIGEHTLTSITAYRTWDSTEIREGDWLDVAAAYPGNSFAQLHDYGPQTQNTFSQELRIASPGGEFLDYVAGVYYSKTEAERYFQRDTIVCRSTTLPADATGLTPCTAAASVFQSPSSNALFSADFENFAAFADGTFNVSDRWRIIAGLRWTKDDLSYVHTYNFNDSDVNGTGPGIRSQAGGGVEVLKDSNSSDEVSGRAGLQFDFTDTLMGYASYARGYKGPAYNVFFNMGPNNTTVIDAETADSYELGLKSSLLDGRMILNAAAFSAKYDNFQANNFLFLNGTLITTLTNAGKVSTEGFEVDFQARPTDAFSIGGGIAYADAKVDRFFTPPGQTPTIADGSRLPLAPEWKASLNGSYRMALSSFDITPTLLFNYTDDQYADLITKTDTANLNLVRIPAYSTVDLSVAIADKDDRYRLTLIGRNLTDESFAALVTRGGPGGAPRLQIPREADRYFGAEFRINFGR
jgi:iron complex outermembrane receptor protein